MSQQLQRPRQLQYRQQQQYQPQQSGQPPSQSSQTASVQPQSGQATRTMQPTSVVGQQFEQTAPPEITKAVTDLDRLANVAEVAKAQAMSHGLSNAVRVADDVSEIATVQKQLILRESPFAASVGESTVQSIQSHLQDLQQFAGEPTIQETLQVAQETVQSVRQALPTLQSFGQQSAQSFGGQGTQSSGGQTDYATQGRLQFQH